MNSIVLAMFICPVAGEPMKPVDKVEAIIGAGLKGDRYYTGEGSWNKGKPGKRQVTLINAIFFKDSEFKYADSRRNIIVEGIELMSLIGKEFQIGNAKMQGLKYCDPCNRPSTLAGNDISFREAFSDRGGLIAEVVYGGIIEVDDLLTPPQKGY